MSIFYKPKMKTPRLKPCQLYYTTSKVQYAVCATKPSLSLVHCACAAPGEIHKLVPSVYPC